MRRPPINHMALRRILGELSRVGNNINQIAHRLNATDQASVPELQATSILPRHQDRYFRCARDEPRNAIAVTAGRNRHA